MTLPSVAVRCDGNNKMGLGHAYRMIALLETTSARYKGVVFYRDLPTRCIKDIEAVSGAKAIKVKPSETIDDELRKIKTRSSAGILVLDGYGFDQQYRAKAQAHGFKVLLIDDFAGELNHVNAVLNHAGGLSSSDYKVSHGTKLALGPEYRLVREIFSKQVACAGRKEGSIVICLGSASSRQLISTMIEAAQRSPEIEEIQVVGSQGCTGQWVKRNNVSVLSNLKGEALAECFNKNDLAIATSSTVALEMATVGIGLITGYTVDNQRVIYNGLTTIGAAFPAGNFYKMDVFDIQKAISKLSTEPYLKSKMLDVQRKTFGGQSNDRVTSLLDEITENGGRN